MASTFCNASHGLGTIAGFILRQTFPGQPGRAHIDAQTFEGATSYIDAITAKRELIAAGDGYAIIDTTYLCGCRGQG